VRQIIVETGWGSFHMAKMARARFPAPGPVLRSGVQRLPDAGRNSAATALMRSAGAASISWMKREPMTTASATRLMALRRLSVADAKPYADWHAHVLSDARQHGFDRVGVERARTRHAL
jgi:hypothetical protein